jgi:hypothetical protein
MRCPKQEGNDKGDDCGSIHTRPKLKLLLLSIFHITRGFSRLLTLFSTIHPQCEDGIFSSSDQLGLHFQVFMVEGDKFGGCVEGQQEAASFSKAENNTVGKSARL